MQQKSSFRDVWTVETANLALLSAVSLAGGIYFLILLSFISRFVPLQSVFQGQVLNEWLWHLKPEREIFLYRAAVFFTLGLAALLFLLLKNKLSSGILRSSLTKLFVIQAAFLAVILIVLFKFAVYGKLPYFEYVGYAAFGLGLAATVFWFKLEGAFSRISLWLQTAKANRLVSLAIDISIPALVILLLFVPDRHSVFARIFVEDLLYHYDGIIMAAGWAFLKGCKFFVDVISQYGMGMPMAVAALAEAFGGFSYESVITVFMVLSLIYLVMCYFFMKAWLKNSLICFVGLMLIIKFQMFHYGVTNPYLWKHPNNLLVRFFFDIPFLFLILLHIRTSLRRYLWAACLTVGIALFYVTDGGAYLLVTLFAYMIWLLLIPGYRDALYRSRKDIVLIAGHFLLPIAVMLALMYAWLGTDIFTGQFWGNFSETARFFTNGLFVLPMYTLIEEKYFAGFFAGFIVPLLYVFNLLFVAGAALAKKADREHIFPVILSVYGLCMYHYYVGRSSHTYFYVVIVPLVLILCFWLKQFTDVLPAAKRQAILVLAAFFSTFALFMTQGFIEYPSVLTLKKVSYEKEREVLSGEYRFEKDARLIESLTDKNEKVALFSSFETAILMAAGRKPFFYYSPLVNSRYRRMQDFGGTYLFTQSRLQKTLDQLENEKPRYIFIEKKLLGGGVMPLYYKRYVSLAVFVTYLQNKYVPVEQGEYLAAFKRKE